MAHSDLISIRKADLISFLYFLAINSGEVLILIITQYY